MIETLRLGLGTARTADAGGYESLVGWLVGFGAVLTGWGGGHRLVWGRSVRFLHDLDVDVVEVDRPNRQARCKEGKSDPVDAVSAARAAGGMLGAPPGSGWLDVGDEVESLTVRASCAKR